MCATYNAWVILFSIANKLCFVDVFGGIVGDEDQNGLSEVSMPIEEQYRSARNRVRRLGHRDSFYVIWAHSQYLQIRDFRFPPEIEVSQRFLALDLPQALIAEWALEQMAREVAMHSGPAAQRGASLKQWATFADIVQRLKDLENDIYGEMNNPADIHLELMRISHRQFTWQQQRPTSRWFMRYYKLFNRPEIDTACREVTGLSVFEVYLIGIALVGIFTANSRTMERMNIEIPGLDQERIERFFRFTSLPLEELRAKLLQEHALDSSYAYRYSSLREFPLIRIRHCGQREIACPVPTLLFWRITSGLYYELNGRADFRAAFGRSFEEYVGDVPGRRITSEGMNVLGEAEYNVGRDRKRTIDWIVTQQDAALLVECKTMRLTWASKAGLTDLTALHGDILKLAKNVIQVYRTIRDYREGHYPILPFVAERAVFPTVVTLEDWYLFGEELPERLDTEVKLLMAENALPEAWLDEMPYSVMSVDEFEKATGIMNLVGVHTFISRKVRDPQRRKWAYHGYYNHCYRDELMRLPTLFDDDYAQVFNGLAPQ